MDNSKEAQYIDLYRNVREVQSSVFEAYRKASFERFKRLGFPDDKSEQYKYTNLTEALSVDYGLDNHNQKELIYEAFTCAIPGIRSHLYFVVNDTFYASDEAKNQVFPQGVVIGSLKEASRLYSDLVAKYFGKLSEKEEDGLIAFNGMFAHDGFFMYVPENVTIDRPIQLVNISEGNTNQLLNSHNLIILERGAKVQLLVCDHTEGNARFFVNRLTEVHVAEEATYEHYKIENTSSDTTHISSLLIDQKESSKTLTTILTLNNGLTRNNISLMLNGEYAEGLLYGMAVGDLDQKVDNHTSILHNKPNCHSTELFKYILGGESQGGFTGRIYVAEDAQKTEAYQNSKNILLSTTARMRTKPQLEIYADDVRCSHGATIGQLDETAMFYLRSRGISEDEARLLLMYAFAADVIENIRIEALKDRIKLMLEHRLRSGVSQAASCILCR